VRYFGYGSNLHLADLARWLGERGFRHEGVRRVGPAWLPDHEPVFHYHAWSRDGGALSVRPRVGAATPGALFDVDDHGWAALDLKEGDKYERREVVILVDGEEVTATTYVGSAPHVEPRHVPPQPHYIGLVREGLADLGLPTHQAEAAAERLRIDPFPRHVFVYGTLMRGELRERLLHPHRPRRWVPSRVRGALVDLGEYPGLVAGEREVAGELIELDDPGAALRELDRVEDFEGYGAPGSLYRRVVVEVDDGTHAWTYRYVGPGGRPIPSGDWRSR